MERLGYHRKLLESGWYRDLKDITTFVSEVIGFSDAFPVLAVVPACKSYANCVIIY